MNEEDFLKNPHFVLDYIKKEMYDNSTALNAMKSALFKYRSLLSYEAVEYNSDMHLALLSQDMYHNSPTAAALSQAKKRSSNSHSSIYGRPGGSTTGGSGLYTYLPLEMLLLELRYNQLPHAFYNNVPCTRPYMCSHDRNVPAPIQVHEATNSISGGSGTGASSSPAASQLSSTDIVAAIRALPPSDYFFKKKGEPGNMSPYYITKDMGFQVNPIGFSPTELVDTRSHMCKHVQRLIGMYKIVFFMQCVRILWPLKPGEFKNPDKAGKFNSTKLVAVNKAWALELAATGRSGTTAAIEAVNTKYRSASIGTSNTNTNTNSASYNFLADGYNAESVLSEGGISQDEWMYVLAFHNITREPNYVARPYPPVGSEIASHVVQLQALLLASSPSSNT